MVFKPVWMTGVLSPLQVCSGGGGVTILTIFLLSCVNNALLKLILTATAKRKQPASVAWGLYKHGVKHLMKGAPCRECSQPHTGHTLTVFLSKISALEDCMESCKCFWMASVPAQPLFRIRCGGWERITRWRPTPDKTTNRNHQSSCA